MTWICSSLFIPVVLTLCGLRLFSIPKMIDDLKELLFMWVTPIDMHCVMN